MLMVQFFMIVVDEELFNCAEIVDEDDDVETEVWEAGRWISRLKLKFLCDIRFGDWTLPEPHGRNSTWTTRAKNVLFTKEIFQKNPHFRKFPAPTRMIDLPFALMISTAQAVAINCFGILLKLNICMASIESLQRKLKDSFSVKPLEEKKDLYEISPYGSGLEIPVWFQYHGSGRKRFRWSF